MLIEFPKKYKSDPIIGPKNMGLWLINLENPISLF